MPLNLYSSIELRFPLIAAVLEKRQHGVILTNSGQNPTHCFVINKFGFCQEFYSEFDAFFFEKIKKLILSQSYPKLRLYAPTSDMESFLQTIDYVERAKRLQFVFSGGVATKPPRNASITIREYSGEDLRITDFGLDLAQRYWDGPEDFLQNGFGFGAFDGALPVGICYAAGIGLDRAEVDVFVEEKYRHHGLGSALSQCFIDKCVEHGIVPNWDCYANNESSILLAERVGFIRPHLYNFFNISGLDR